MDAMSKQMDARLYSTGLSPSDAKKWWLYSVKPFFALSSGCVIKLYGFPPTYFIISGTVWNINWGWVVNFVQIKQRCVMQWSVSKHIMHFELANGLWIHCNNPLYWAVCNEYYKITERLFIGKAEWYVEVIPWN